MDLYDPPSSAVIVIGTTAITGGTDTRVLFDDGGKIGESSGFTYTKASGLLRSTIMMIGGATPGTDAFGVTGTSTFTGAVSLGNSNISSTGVAGWNGSTWGLNWAAARSFTMSSLGTIGFAATDNGTVANDGAWSRLGAASAAWGNGTQGDFSGALKFGSLTTTTFVSDLGYNYQTPSTGFTITMANGNYHLILDPAGTLATGTITMCAAPVDGQCVDIKISQIITALTVAGNSGQSVKGNPTSAAVGSSFTGIYRATNTTWYF